MKPVIVFVATTNRTIGGLEIAETNCDQPRYKYGKIYNSTSSYSVLYVHVEDSNNFI